MPQPKADIRTMLAAAARIIERFDAEVLLAHVVGRSRTWLVAHANEEVAVSHRKRFQALVAGRMRFEPVAYLTGQTSFYARPFFTDARALIPRPETEDMVSRTLKTIRQCPQDWTVWDVGTGSGAVAVSLGAEEAALRVVATDISAAALRLARKNAHRHRVTLQFLQADLCTERLKRAVIGIGRPHLAIVANLPYLPVTDKKTMMKDVKNYEPHQALFAPERGMRLIVSLLKQLSAWQERPSGVIICEHDPPQARALVAVAKSCFPNAHVQTMKDMYGRQRFLEIRDKGC